MAVEFTKDELHQVYEAMNRAQQFLKRREQMLSALEFDDKPAAYSPLVQAVMAARNMVGEKVGALHNADVEAADRQG